MVEDREVRLDALGEALDGSRLGLRERFGARVVPAGGVRACLPADREVAVEVDALGVLALVLSDAVGVDGLDKPDRKRVRALVAQASDDPYTLQRFGDMRVRAIAAAALADRAAAALQRAWARQDALTADERAEVALAVSEAKIVAQRAALENGVRSTAGN